MLPADPGRGPVHDGRPQAQEVQLEQLRHLVLHEGPRQALGQLRGQAQVKLHRHRVCALRQWLQPEEAAQGRAQRARQERHRGAQGAGRLPQHPERGRSADSAQGQGHHPAACQWQAHGVLPNLGGGHHPPARQGFADGARLPGDAIQAAQIQQHHWQVLAQLQRARQARLRQERADGLPGAGGGAPPVWQNGQERLHPRFHAPVHAHAGICIWPHQPRLQAGERGRIKHGISSSRCKGAGGGM
mmetsp:Transcript_827/g.2514  ORF Transcript_827/g.2514 Transcript_827/m.2514 type:complete len:244 (-) Transcript_827:288-1019(-)